MLVFIRNSVIVRQNLDTKIDGTTKIIESLKEKYNLILLSDHIKKNG